MPANINPFSPDFDLKLYCEKLGLDYEIEKARRLSRRAKPEPAATPDKSKKRKDKQESLL